MKRGFEGHEDWITRTFALASTISSGSKFFDPGDAVTRGHDHPFPLYVDGKFTDKASRSISLKELGSIESEALALGKRMVMALRFWPVKHVAPEDYVVLTAHDFAELLQMVIKGPIDRWVL